MTRKRRRIYVSKDAALTRTPATKIATTNDNFILGLINPLFCCNGQHGTTTTDDIEPSISCSKQSESYSFEIPTIYTIVFMSIIFLCSILYYFELIINRQVYVKHGSIKSYITRYLLIGWKFKSMYSSLFTQLFDQVSDISVILQLYYLSNDEIVVCYHMNTYYIYSFHHYLYFYFIDFYLLF